MGKQIKIMKSDRSGKYYGRYTKRGQLLGPFARFLQELSIVAQYTMFGSPSQNGVLERHNRTLKDMVRSMISNSNLLLSLWSEVIKTTTYVLNQVLTKVVSKTPFGLWKGWKLGLRHVQV